MAKSSDEYTAYIAKWKLREIEGLKGTSEVSGHVRRYLMNKYHSSCASCGWCTVNTYTGKTPLHIHHIDGDYRNNCEDNLTLLCPNCHSLTESYGSRNRGKGRPDRCCTPHTVASSSPADEARLEIA